MAIDREEFEALRASHNILRRAVERAAMRGIARERRQTEAEMDRRLQVGSLTGRTWPTRGQQPAAPSRLDMPLLTRLREDIDSLTGSPNAAAGLMDPISSGLLNGSFQESPPQGHGSTISLENQLPYWAFNLTEVAAGRVTVLPETTPDAGTGGAVATWVDLPTELSIPGGAVKFVTSASGAIESYIKQSISNPPAFSRYARPVVYVNAYVPAGSEGTDVELYVRVLMGNGSFITAVELQNSTDMAGWASDVHTFVVDPNLSNALGTNTLSPTYGADYESPLSVEIGVYRVGAGGTALTAYILGAGVIWESVDRALYLRALDPALTGDPETYLGSGVVSDRRALFVGTDDKLYMVGTSGVPVAIGPGAGGGGSSAFSFFMS